MIFINFSATNYDAEVIRMPSLAKFGEISSKITRDIVANRWKIAKRVHKSPKIKSVVWCQNSLWIPGAQTLTRNK